MDDDASCKVENAELCEPSASPDPVRDRQVNEREPQRNEKHPRTELHALDKCARDKSDRNRGKRHLKYCVEP